MISSIELFRYPTTHSGAEIALQNKSTNRGCGESRRHDLMEVTNTLQRYRQLRRIRLRFCNFHFAKPI